MSTLLGLTLTTLVGWLCWMAGYEFSFYLAVLQIFLFLFFGIFFIMTPRDKKTTASGARAKAVSQWWVVAVALLVAVFFVAAPPHVNPAGDAYDHIGYVRTIVIEDDMAPGGVLAPAVFDDTRLKTDPRKGTLHPLLAAMSELAALDPHQVWVWMPVVLAPIAVLAFLGFATALLPGAGFVLFTAILFLMFQGGLGREFLGTITYGQHLSLVFFWLTFVIVLSYVRDGGWRRLATVLALLFGGALMHIGVLVHFVLMYVSLIVFFRVFDARLRPVITLGAASALCSIIVLAWKVSESYQPGNYLHLHPQGLLYFIDIGDPFYVVSPVELLKKNGLLFFAGMCLVPALLFIKTYRRHALMSLALAVPPIVIALNPLLAPLVYNRVGYLLHRLVLNVPAVVVTALVLGSLVAWARRGRPLAPSGLVRKAILFVVLFVWAQVFLLSFGAWRTNMRSIRWGPGDRLDPASERLVEFINDKTIAGSVVLSDPVTSYMLSAFSHAKVVAVLHQHGTPNDPLALDRLESIRAALSPSTTQVEALRAIKRYGVQYVVLNGSIRRPVHDFLADWDSTHLPDLKQKFGTLIDGFASVYDEDGIVVYRVLGTMPKEYTWYPVGTVFAEPDVEWTSCERPAAGSEALQVAKVALHPAEVLPGEMVTFALAYQKSRDIDNRLPLRLHIRLEDPDYFERARSYPGDKYVRRYLERRNAAFFRFRLVHNPFGGFYPPELWPHGREVYESFRVLLPTDLAPTDYELQFKLTHETLIANYSIRDFFFNDDSLVGMPCSELRVRKFLTR
jgi:hypothetical protein